MTTGEHVNPADDENAHRLLAPGSVNGDRITPAAFPVTRAPGNAKYYPISTFIEERMPEGLSPEQLHVERFQAWGRFRFPSGSVRGVSYVNGAGERVECDFELVMSPEDCGPPLVDFAASHANLSGGTNKDKWMSALVHKLTQTGSIERMPSEGE